ncbi:MAG: cell division protein FtsQ/DivIB [Lachnospiraceae bacterium]|nr:cell division protein FtsQ/DivIB [Lachnospiraceae bacterium]
MRKRRKRWLANLWILLALAAAVLVVLLVFRVRKVTVVGNSRYSAEEIQEDLITDFLSGNTLCLWWTYKGGEIPDSMPYLETMKITVDSPFSVTITVSEKELIGYFDTGSYAYFDENGIILEITDEVYDGIPVITGASLGEINLYQKVPTESSSQLRTILSLLDLLDYNELTASEIRFAEDSEITVYIGYIEAILGQDEYLEEKVANLKAILNTMTSTTAGTLHLETVSGKNEDNVFAPSDEVSEETETETESGDSGTVDTGTSDTSTLAGTTTDGSTADTGSGTADSDTTGTGSGTADADSSDEADASDDEESDVDLMVFNSSGQLVYHVHVKNGVVVDSNGDEVPGCYVNEDGYVVDAYMNIIDPATGDLMN